MKFRTLTAKEIECRVGMKGDNYCTLLLYKDARVDQRLLDEVVGPMNWQREHQVVNGNLYCTVSIYDEKKGTWVNKQDVGTESNTEKQKGEASDSFKRACFNWGIGRELYTAPNIFINLKADDYNRDKKLSTKFSVSDIDYTDGEITRLVIIDNKYNIRYTYGAEISKTKANELQPQNNADEVEARRKKCLAKFAELSVTSEQICELLGITNIDKINKEHLDELCEVWYSINNGDTTIQEIFGKNDKLTQDAMAKAKSLKNTNK
jgi:hypothetical protein